MQGMWMQGMCCCVHHPGIIQVLSGLYTLWVLSGPFEARQVEQGGACVTHDVQRRKTGHLEVALR